MTWLASLADRAVARELPTRTEALAVLASGDDELMDVVAAAFRVRRQFFGRRVKLNYLVNVKSGLCPEDCFYCSQRAGSAADVLKYTWLKTDEVIASAEAGVAGGARRVCLVASGRGPTDKDIDRVAGTIAAFKERNPAVEVCACLGLLSDGQAERLAAAGTTAYNHNLNTSGGHYADICSTHEYADRVSTVEQAKSAGLSPCSGLIAGMGETDEDLVDVAFALRAMSPDSVPVNFLIPFDGTPLEGRWELTPQRCLRILAMVRFVNPDAEVRLAGGREIHLRTLQPLALHVVNSIFLGDYLTSEGQPGAADLAMIADAGFTVEGAEDAPGELAAALARPDLVQVRRRGAGTALPANTVLPVRAADVLYPPPSLVTGEARTSLHRCWHPVGGALSIARTRRRRAVPASFARHG
jgi:biotin synthase